MVAKMTNAEYLKQLRAKAVERGLCYVCRCRFPRPGVRTCDECLRRQGEAKRGKPRTAHGKERVARRQRERVAERHAAGMCIKCGWRPNLAGYSSCMFCLDDTAERTRMSMEAKRRRSGVELRGPRPCTLCGQLGHDRRRHERPMTIRTSEVAP